MGRVRFRVGIGTTFSDRNVVPGSTKYLLCLITVAIPIQLIGNHSKGGESKGVVVNPDFLNIKLLTAWGLDIADCRFLQIRLVVGKLSIPGLKPFLKPESRYCVDFLIRP